MTLPELGATVRLYPAPVANAEMKPGRPVPLRRVQDGAGNYGRFLPEEGAERVFDCFFAQRLLAGDVMLTNPRGAPVAAPVAPAAPAAPMSPAPPDGAPVANP